jgi:glutamine amidotransferase
LADLLLDRSHALVRQSWAPKDMRGSATINADGFGAGWYLSENSLPIRYRRAVPMWTDTNFAALAGSISAGAVLAAVRAASVGMPVIDTACAPFAWDRWLFSHNGLINGWPDTIAGIADSLPVTDLLTMDAPTDSALLFALVCQGLRAGKDPEDVLANLVTDVAAVAPSSRLNLLLTDGATVYATTWDHALSFLSTPDHIVVASEPWDDDPAWQPVADRKLLVANKSDVALHDLNA